MWLREWCELVIDSGFLICVSLFIIGMHFKVVGQLEQECKQGSLPKTVIYSYVLAFCSLIIGFGCICLANSVFYYSGHGGTVYPIVGMLLIFTLPLFICAKIAQRYPLCRELMSSNGRGSLQVANSFGFVMSLLKRFLQ